MLINLISVSLLLTFVSIQANFIENVIKYCEKRGIDVTDDNKDCNFTLTVKLPSHLLIKCKEAFVEKCRNKQRIDLCTKGIQYAIDFNKCFQKEPNAPDEFSTFMECCKACIAGMNAEDSASCTDSVDHSLLLNASNSCCQIKRIRRSSDTLPESVPEFNDTTLLPCVLDYKCPENEYCDDTNGTKRCICFPGYHRLTNGTCIETKYQKVPSDNDYIDYDVPIDNGENCSPGFKYNPTSKECCDVNECEEDANICMNTEDCINTHGGFSCTPKKINGTHCLKGYELVNSTCSDIDECKNPNACDETKVCENVDGSFICIDKETKFPELNDDEPMFDYNCHEGFEFDMELGQCKDINECRSGIHNCNEGQVCKNTDGSFICEESVKCGPGFQLSHDGECVENTANSTGTTPKPWDCHSGFVFNEKTNNCEDINECLTNKICKQDEDCHNIPGSYQCRLRCGGGMEEQNGTCVDIDECERNTYDCPSNQECFNKNNGYDCRPKIATTETIELEELIPNDETETKTEGSTESNSDESRRSILCPSGYQLNEKSNICEDINECSSDDTNLCASYQKCVNSNGSYACEEKVCEIGFELSFDGECVKIKCDSGKVFDKELRMCVDYDECEQKPCKDDEECVNLQGSFKCRNVTKCSSGHTKSLFGHCVDVNECEESKHNCSVQRHEKCVNRLGSFECICTDGFEKNPETGKCEDIDECTGFTPCILPKIFCENTVGSFNCTCSPGFVENNGECELLKPCESNPCHKSNICSNLSGFYHCDCKKGYKFSDSSNTTCVDVNECETEKGKYCHNCRNTDGSYECECEKGRQVVVNDDEKRCLDLDECTNDNPCTENEICTNLYPGYRCTNIACNDPYYNHRKKKRACLKKTWDKDRRNPLYVQYHALGFRNNYTIPAKGLSVYTVHIKGVDCEFVHQLEKVENMDVNAKKSFSDIWKLEIHDKNMATLVLQQTLIGPQEIEISVDCKAHGFIAHRTFVFVYVSKSDY